MAMVTNDENRKQNVKLLFSLNANGLIRTERHYFCDFVFKNTIIKFTDKCLYIMPKFSSQPLPLAKEHKMMFFLQQQYTFLPVLKFIRTLTSCVTFFRALCCQNQLKMILT